MAGASNSITTHNVLSGVLNADNVISGLVNTAFNPAYALVTQAGAQIVLFINSNDYKMYAQLKDKSGNLIYTSNIIDLPLETMVVDGRYDSNTKKLILVLDNGNEIEVPLEALINGLVNEDDLIANYYDKDEIDALLNGYWTKIELTQEDIDNWNAKQEYLNQGDGIEISADTILKGNTRQESTTGKNLLNIFNFEMGAMSNGSIMSSPYRINNVNNPIEVKPNTTYCISSVLSTQVKGMRCGIHECDENMTFKKDSDWQQLATNPYVFTTENYTKYVKIVFTLSTTSTNVQTNITEDVTSYNNAVDWARGCLFQLEEGNTATEYEPYTGGNPAPNPDYPIPVNVVTGDNEVKVEGKNLFDISKLNSTNLTNAIIGSNTITLTGTNDYHSTVTGTNLGDIADLEIGKTYTLTFDTTYTGNNKNKMFLRGSQSYWESGTSLTITQEMLNDRFAFYGTNNAVISNIMIRLSSVNDASYVPYQSQTYPINLGSMELCKIGDYQDYLYKENGIWYKYGAIGKTEVNLTGNVGSLPNSNKYNAFVPTNKAQIYGNLCYCNKANYNQDNPQDGQFYQNVPNVVYVGNSTDTLATLKQKYDGSLLYYILNTPTTTEITDTTLISQLNALTTGFSNNWVENISQTNTDLPFEIKYDNKNLTISASSNLVRDTDYATNQTGGVIKTGGLYGTGVSSGILMSVIKTYEQYQSSSNMSDYGFVSKGTLENVITGKELTNKTYVDAADAAFESELFDDGVISIEDSTEANINNTMNKSQLKIDLKGNTSQESTTGKNLIHLDSGTFSSGGITWTITDSTISTTDTATGTWSSLNNFVSFSTPLEAGTYTFSIPQSLPKIFQIVLRDENNTNHDVNVDAGDTSKTITTTYTAVYWKVAYRVESESVSISIPNKLQFEKGNQATSYEPYTGGNPAPNPDYPYPVNVVTGDNEVKVEGKNLCPTQENAWEQGSISSANGSLTSSTTRLRTKDYYSIKNDTDYYISIQGTTDYCFLNIHFYNANKQWISSIVDYNNIDGKTSKAINIASSSIPNIAYMKIIVRNKINDATITASEISTIKPQIELGTSFTGFEEYQSQTYPINLGSMELCKIGDYQDRFIRNSGKNLYNKAISTFDGYIINDGTETQSANYKTSDYIPIEPNTTYATGIMTNPGSNPSRCYYDENKTFISGEKHFGATTMVGTSPNNAKYMRESIPVVDIDKVQIEKGNSISSYEPYGTGQWCKYNAIGKITYTGANSENWDIENRDEFHNFKIYLSTSLGADGTITCISNYFKAVTGNQSYWGTYPNSIGIGGSKTLRIGKSDLEDVSALKTWLSTHNTEVQYVLATPYLSLIESETLQSQLDAIEKAYSYDTQTNISQTNQDKPFILDINAIADNVNGLKLENENQEYKTNKVIELSSNSTDDEYPSAKCVYDIVGNIEAVLAAMDSGSGV